MKKLLFALIATLTFISTQSQRTNIDKGLEQALIDLGYDDVLDFYVLTANIVNIKTLDLSSKSLRNVSDLNKFPSLESVNLSNNDIGSLWFSENVPNLEVVIINNNPLQYANLSKSSKLKIFSALNGDRELIPNYLNKITAAKYDFSFNPLLEELFLGSESIIELNVSQNPKLHTLNIQNTKLTSLELTNTPSIQNFTSKQNVNLACIKVSNSDEVNTNTNFSVDNYSQFAEDCSGFTLDDRITGIQEITNDNGTLHYNEISTGTHWLNDPEKQDFTKYPFLLPGSQFIVYTEGNDIESVHFEIEYAYVHTRDEVERKIIVVNEPPYTFPHPGSQNSRWEGRISIEATPYTMDNAEGIAGETFYRSASILEDWREFSDILKIKNLNDDQVVYEVKEGEGEENNIDLNLTMGQTVYFEAEPKNSYSRTPITYDISGPNIDDSSNYFSFSGVMPYPDGVKLTEGTYTINLGFYWSDGWLRPSRSSEYKFTVSNPEQAGKTYIPDDNFEQYLIDQGYDDILDDYVLTENISTVDFIGGRGYQDLTGLQDFVALERLALSNNAWSENNTFTQIDVSANTKLEQLWLSGNAITALDLSKNKALTDLDINATQLTSLDISNNLKLRRLELAESTINSLELSKNTELEKLNIFNTSFKELNIEKNIKLTSLNVAFTPLETLDVSKNTLLTDFRSDNTTQLNCIQVSENQQNNIPADWSKDDSAQYSLNCSETFSGSITGFQEITNDNGTLYYHDIIGSLFRRNDPEKQDITKYPFLLPESEIVAYTEGDNIESVKFEIFNSGFVDGNPNPLSVKIDNEPPYTTGYLYEGNISIIAIPYSEDDAKGIEGEPKSIGFTLLDYYDEFSDTLNIKNLVDDSIVLEVIKGEENIFDLRTLQSQKIYFEALNKIGYPSPFDYFITGPNTNITGEIWYSSDGPFPFLNENGLELEVGSYTIELNQKRGRSDDHPGIDIEWSFTITDSEEISKTLVPDNNFEQALIDLGYDDVLDNYVLTENIIPITELVLTGKGIQGLTGLQDFSALKSLDLANNPISEIDISANLELQILLLGNTEVDAFDVSRNNTLIELDLNGTEITTIDVSNNPNLERLEIAHTNVHTLDLSNNNSLEKLNIFNTTIANLYLEENLMLNYLNASATELTTLDVSKNASLTTLITTNSLQLSCIQVSSIQLNAIPSNWVKASTAQYLLDCSSTTNEEFKTFVPDNNFEQALIDLGYDDMLDNYVITENIATINELAFLGKGIQDLTGLQDFLALKSLDVADNPINEIDVSANTALEILLLGNTNITELNLTKNSELLELDANGTEITLLDLYSNLKLQRLEIADSKIASIDIFANSSLEKLNIFNTAITNLYLEENLLLNYLNASRTQLRTLDVSKNTSLTTFIANNSAQLNCIKVNESQLNTIPQNWIKDNAAQYALDCSISSTEGLKTFVPDNNFEQALIDLGYDDVLDDYVLTKNISEVKELNLLGKGIQNITGLQDFQALSFLDAADNPISQINVTKNAELEILLLGATAITGLNVSKNYALRELDLNGTPITALNVNKNTNLERLEIADGNIVAIDVSENITLKKLNIFNTAIAMINLEKNALLNYLNVSSSQLINLDVSNNSDLTSLDATNNPQLGCIQVSENQMNGIPTNWIKNDSAPYALDCSGTAIADEDSNNDGSGDTDGTVTEENELVDSLMLFPTATDGIITIQNNLEHEIGDVSVRSLNGIAAKYMFINSNPKEIKIDLRGKAKGMYIVQIQRISGEVDLIKIMLH